EQGYPINTWYHDVKHQSLYLASDLSNAGILSGSVITGIKFKVNQTPGRNLDSLRIAYSWTSNTEISSFDTTTVVHGPTNYFMSEFLPNNWVQFDFITPITWDGVNNLIIEYSHDNSSYVTGGGTYMRNAGTNRGRKGWTDSGAGHYPFNGSGMTEAPDSKVASIRLVIEEADVFPPTDLIATPSYQQVDLSWTASTSDSIANYLIYRGGSTEELDSIDAVASTVTSYSDSGLTNGTTYYYGVKTKMADDSLSAMSTPVSVTPSVETPAINSPASGSQQVTLTWDAPSGSGVDSVYIYKGITTAAQVQDTVVAGSITSYTFTGLTNGTTYWFSIKYKGLDESFSATSESVYSTPGYTGPAWYVSSSGNNSTGDGSSSAPFATLDYAIGEAAENDTIKLKP
ncbi:MAG: fibronectin type III domain-containing protein, partial [Candidatus Marinimicrobia bacterium]|nr:fibronectin type III domain-containing protein [Candidatus Neomarinimicrobiota bacterium]